MPKRRPYGSGSLDELPGRPGTWRYRIYLPRHPATGKQTRRTWTFQAGSLKDAQRHVQVITKEFEQAPVLAGGGITVAHMLNEFMSFSQTRDRSPKTLFEYQRVIDHFFVPTIGHIAINKLTAHDLDSLYRAALQRDKPLKPTSIRRYHAVLSAALNQAVRWGWLDKSPTANVTLPSIKVRAPEVPTSNDINRLIAAAYAHSEGFGVFIVLATITGARRGELAALRWTDVTGDHINIHSSVYSTGDDYGIKSTKSGNERLVQIGPRSLELLNSWRASCQKKADEFHVELADNAFIFSLRPDGHSPMNVDTITSTFRKVADSLDPPLKHVHLHSLRHYAATELLGAGVNARDAADRLGHADPSITLRIYAHATTERQRAAALLAERSF